MLIYNKFILFVMILYIQEPSVVKSEYFTAIENLKSLISLEKQFTSLVDKYILEEEKKIQEIQKIASVLFPPQQFNEDSSSLHNPINIFHLITKMTRDLKYINKKMSSLKLTEIMEKFPKLKSFPYADDSELQGVSVALGRLAFTYNLDVSSLANGKVTDRLNITSELTAYDCLTIGANLAVAQMFFKSIPWLLESLIRQANGSDKTLNIKEVTLEFLGNATFLTKNETIKVIVENQLKALEKQTGNRYMEYFLMGYEATKHHVESDNINFADQSVDTFDPFYSSLENFNRLCRNEKLMSKTIETKLKCYYIKKKSHFLTLQPPKIEVAHVKPWIVVIHDVLTDKEIDTIKQLSTPNLRRAEVGDVGEVADFRISKSSWLEDSQHKTIATVTHRLQEITGLNVQNASEKLQVVNYGIGGFYDTHFDFDDTVGLGNVTKTYPLGNRVATVLIYMSDVIAGGGTVFPQLNITITPVKGSAAFWYNLLKTGEGDYLTEHGGCPVLAGSKWVSNKWIVERHQEFRRPCGLTKKDKYSKI